MSLLFTPHKVTIKKPQQVVDPVTKVASRAADAVLYTGVAVHIYPEDSQNVQYDMESGEQLTNPHICLHDPTTLGWFEYGYIIEDNLNRKFSVSSRTVQHVYGQNIGDHLLTVLEQLEFK